MNTLDKLIEYFKQNRETLESTMALLIQALSQDSSCPGMNEERSRSDYSEFTSQSAALARRRLLDESGCSEL